MALRHRIFVLLEPDETGNDPLSRAVDIGLMTLILLNVVVVILATVEGIRSTIPLAFDLFDRFSLAVFSIEYVLRIWACVEDPRYDDPIRGRLRYVITPMALVDLIAIAPLFFPFAGTDLRSVRALRLLRMLRVFKFSRYSRGVAVMLEVLKKRREELVAALGMLVTLLIVASTVVYYAERNAQPDKFSSIPVSMWWGIATLTTVGYGDITPVTLLGRVFGSLVAVGGLLLVALPTGIVGAGFVAEFEKWGITQDVKDVKEIAESIEEEVERIEGSDVAVDGSLCPHCGLPTGEVPP